MRRFVLALAALALASPESRAQTGDRVPSADWEVPFGGRPRDPYVAPDGSVFFVGQSGNYIGRLDPRGGTFTRFEIDSGTNPHNLIIDRDGNVWYSGNRNGMIGMAIAVITTLVTHSVANIVEIGIAIFLGGIIGVTIARRIAKAGAMPSAKDSSKAPCINSPAPLVWRASVGKAFRCCTGPSERQKSWTDMTFCRPARSRPIGRARRSGPSTTPDPGRLCREELADLGR